MNTYSFKEYIDFMNNWNTDPCNKLYFGLKNVEYNKDTNEIKFKKEYNMKTINTNFKIKDYKVYNNKAVVVEFTDGTKEKAVVHNGDTFDLERAVEICVLKHIFGKDKYKSILHTAMRQIKDIDKAIELEKQMTKEIEEKKAKAEKRKAKYIERKRKERVAEMTEAYLNAMKLYGSSDIRDIRDSSDISDICDNCIDHFDDLK